MDKVSDNDVEWLLNLHKEQPDVLKPAKKKPFSLQKTLLWLAIVISGLFGLILLPFFLLIRTSVWLYLAQGLPGWLALGGGILATVFLLLIYVFVLFRKIQNKKRLLHYSLAGIGTMVFGFCLFSLFYLSGVNAKTPEVRSVYRSMHPILRVAISTVTLADGDLVITDIERVLSDYQVMGLPVNPNSLHFRQESGYVHAVDLRTRDQGAVRNFLLKSSLEVMGFRTLRHTGTADHLHVALLTID